MSISPPSDIVLDVARAADPTRYAEAAARLTRAAAPAGGFSTMMAASTGCPRNAENTAAAKSTIASGFRKSSSSVISVERWREGAGSFGPFAASRRAASDAAKPIAGTAASAPGIAVVDMIVFMCS